MPSLHSTRYLSWAPSWNSTISGSAMTPTLAASLSPNALVMDSPGTGLQGTAEAGLKEQGLGLWLEFVGCLCAHAPELQLLDTRREIYRLPGSAGCSLLCMAQSPCYQRALCVWPRVDLLLQAAAKDRPSKAIIGRQLAGDQNAGGS